MKNIYILDEHQSSKRNGIGTYLKELIYCLQQLDVNTCLISFNSDEKEFKIVKDKNKNLKYIYFPFLPDNEHFFNNHIIIEKFFRLYIKDSHKNIFFLNHAPCDQILKTLKNSYPLSKLLFVNHDFGWTYTLLENSEKMKKIVLSRNNKKVQDKYSIILSRFDKEIEMYNTADGVICLCDEAYRTVFSLYNKSNNNVYLIENGCRDNHFHSLSEREKQKIRKEFKIEREEKILIFAARLSPTKGIINILNAFCRIVESFPNTRLVIAGSTENKRFYEYLLLLSQKAVTKISFIGQISYDEINQWYQISDIGIAATRVEQCSYTGIEMQKYSLPILASDGFGVKNMFIDGENAIVAKIGNNDQEFEDNLVNAMRKLLSSPTLCNALSINARETYESRYSINNMIKSYQDLISSL